MSGTPPEKCDRGVSHAAMPCGCCWHTPGHEHAGVIGPRCTERVA